MAARARERTQQPPGSAPTGPAPPAPATLARRVLAMQREAGNAAVARVLARKGKDQTDEERLAAASTKGGSQKGLVDTDECPVYDRAGPDGEVIDHLPRGTRVRVLASAGRDYMIEHKGGRAFTPMSGIDTSRRAWSVTLEELFKVYPDLAADAAKDATVMEKAKSYLRYMNEAFDLFEFDTLESQATFLAHGWAESDQFRRFTEATLGQERYIDDPLTTKLETSYLDKQYPEGSANRRSINPDGPSKGTGTWQYLGRGATQVTHSYNYARACKFMDLQAGLIEEWNPEGAARLREAARKIRGNSREAARPMYTFLFSAAAGKMANLDRPRQVYGKQLRNRTYNAGAVTGGHKDPQAKGKQDAFTRALDNL